MRNKWLVILIISLLTNSVTKGQTRYSGWLASFNSIKTGNKTSIINDIQVRSTDEVRQIQTLLLRGGFSYQFSKKWIASAGYAFIRNQQTVGIVKGYAAEHRIWQQVVHNHSLKPVLISHRFRLEQRFLPKTTVINNSLEKDGSVYANRFRYFIRNMLPLNKEAVFTKGVFVALQNEVFVNFGNTANVNGESFDQNRVYLAVGFRISKEFDIEGGYMNQYINGRGSSFTNNHIAQLAGYLRL